MPRRWLFVFGRNGWSDRKYAKVAVAMGAAAWCYTVFSEWLNVEVRGSWAYLDLMPTIPLLGTGVTPILQWLVVPAVAFWWARRGNSRGAEVRMARHKDMIRINGAD